MGVALSAHTKLRVSKCVWEELTLIHWAGHTRGGQPPMSCDTVLGTQVLVTTNVMARPLKGLSVVAHVTRDSDRGIAYW